MIAIGIDTGSTSTDAVIYDLARKKILAFAKSVTTHEHLETGIREALCRLPREMLAQAGYLSLSTTLATNACVEKKGENVCLLFIGASRDAVEWTLSSYGFESMDFMRFIDGDASKGIAPDWEALDALLPEVLRSYGSIAVAQIGARENDGLYERLARERIASVSDIPVTCSYEIFHELNVIKRGAGALLNARMAPVIADFFRAIHQVLREEGLEIPVFVMRSDGSLVSEEYTLQYPVETLVCGPTASVKGAMELFQEENAVVVDMGGTTSDLAIIRGGAAKIDNEGIRLAGWQTFVRGVSIETLGLGGDSRVCYGRGRISLDSRRALPMSILAGEHPEILPELEALAAQASPSVLPLYEYFLLLREDWQGPRGRLLTDTERHICTLLEQGPLSVTGLARGLDMDEYTNRTDRLERLGLVLRCGFTPTDAILLRGDRRDSAEGAYGDLLSTDAARRGAEASLRFLQRATGLGEQALLEAVYTQVKEKLYCAIVRMLWLDRYKTGRQTQLPADLEKMARMAYREAMGEQGDGFYRCAFSTRAVLLGSGAPTHIFLPDVARALQTHCRVSPFSAVSNALGAMLGSVCVYDTVAVRAERLTEDSQGRDFWVYGTEKMGFETMKEAVEYAAAEAEKRAAERARRCGAVVLQSVSHEVQEKTAVTIFGSVPLGADVTACARGALESQMPSA